MLSQQADNVGDKTMPFPDLTSLGFTALEDSQYFQTERISGAQTYETDGGIFITRKRFTRNPGQIITTGFTEISDADKVLFDQFYENNAGQGATEVNYVHPLTGVTMPVYFSETTPYTAQYKGWGANKVWTITDIRLRAQT